MDNFLVNTNLWLVYTSRESRSWQNYRASTTEPWADYIKAYGAIELSYEIRSSYLKELDPADNHAQRLDKVLRLYATLIHDLLFETYRTVDLANNFHRQVLLRERQELAQSCHTVLVLELGSEPAVYQALGRL